MAKQICHLARRQGFDGTVRLLHTVHQIRGKGVAQGVEALPLDASCLQDPVVPFPEDHRPRIIPALVAYKGCTRAEVVLPAQVL